MKKAKSLRLRITLFNTIALSIACLCLTLLLNISAYQMADVIQTIPLTPATSATELTFAQFASDQIPATATFLAAKNVFSLQSITFMFLIIGSGSLLTYYICGRALRPLAQLNELIQSRTVHNLNQTVEIPTTYHEVAQLNASLNQLSSELGAAFARQQRFSLNAAHELRTPLAILKTKVEVFQKRHDHSLAESDQFLSTLGTNIDRLSQVVASILELSQIDALDCDDPVELRGLIAEIVDELRIIAANNVISCHIIGDHELYIMGNEQLMYQACYNLIENAIKYNVPNGAITITLKAGTDYHEIQISDTGIGIPQSAYDLIFEPFYRVEQSRSRQKGGAGLGLATVKQIISCHQGTISLKPHYPRGTTFNVTLPAFKIDSE